MLLLKLTRSIDKKAVLVNPMQIASVMGTEDNDTRVCLGHGDMIHANETPEDIAAGIIELAKTAAKIGYQAGLEAAGIVEAAKVEADND